MTIFVNLFELVALGVLICAFMIIFAAFLWDKWRRKQ